MKYDLYSCINQWKGKPYYDDFHTLVDMAYELQERYSRFNVKTAYPVADNISLFYIFDITQSSQEDSHLQDNFASDIAAEIINYLVRMEKILDNKIERRQHVSKLFPFLESLANK